MTQRNTAPGFVTPLGSSQELFERPQLIVGKTYQRLAEIADIA
jgi:hypothetical protein